MADELAGEIVVDDFRESFHMSADYWGAEEYVQSWRRSFEVLLSGEEARSCFVSSITDPENTNFIMMWPLHRRGDLVFVQNSILFLAELEEPFSALEPWRSVGPRETVSEDGDRVSEWSCPLDDVRNFFHMTR
ncbi:hypothetical protein N8J89_35730 [Crossiella sp. CA-258035]|uniref:hypothetical protein n=1 Tax=Crossiella sp. CA-258035 TaxID=2981138 RepID=UPI0024BC2E46|nr:hypothetical protein [Crossiella sp. CA-258035]WHT18409.1 hypothetical protein N8J89_35730 [Crossiella sp. CA-258035]